MTASAKPAEFGLWRLQPATASAVAFFFVVEILLVAQKFGESTQPVSSQPADL
jgi:hypothetical protein